MEKRAREEDNVDGDRTKKRERASHDDDDDDAEEMEIDEDEEQQAQSGAGMLYACVTQPSASHLVLPKAKAGPSIPTSSKLICTNLPQEVTDDVLSVLFSQYAITHACYFSLLTFRNRYKGFQTTAVTPSPTPKIKMAQVTFESADLATIARDALDGFTLKKGWKMGVAFT
jgi:U2 small nuclear ribonucleoprotein B''